MFMGSESVFDKMKKSRVHLFLSLKNFFFLNPVAQENKIKSDICVL